MSLETVGRSDTDLWERLGAFQAATADVASIQDLDQVVEQALEHALDLTGAAVAFIGILDEAGNRQQVYSRATDPTQSLLPEEMDRLVAGSANGNREQVNLSYLGERRFSSCCGQPLRAGGRLIGMMGVASAGDLSASQRGAFAILANHVAAAVEIIRLNQRRQEIVDALGNLRVDLDRSEKERILNAERAKGAIQLDRAHELAVNALVAVSVYARSGEDLTSFYRRLTASVAELVGAGKVLFWQLNENRTLTAIPGAHGVDDSLVARLYPAPAEPYGDDLTSRAVYEDTAFRADRSDQASEYKHVLEVLGVSNAMSVPWRAGDQRLGVIAAYDSKRPEGFSDEDTWVLRMAALAAGLVWQLKHAEADLTMTIERLQKVDTARQLLLKNVSTAVDKARKRFASELHDDALQKLTAAELQLRRASGEAAEAGKNAPIDNAQALLEQAEEALRKLLFEVQPPSLDAPGGFEKTILDRVEIMRSLSGVEVEVELQLPDDQPYEIKSIVFRQIAESLSNVEKHAAATRVKITVKSIDGAIHGEVVDDGRGFVVAERDHLPGHLGLLALKERALLAGGWCSVTSEPGAGTKVEFSVPTAL